MNTKIVYIVYAVLFLFMICDLIFSFPLILRAIFYGSCFVIGGIIYYSNFFKPNSENRDN